MITQYYLQRIVKTDNPLVHRYIWEDLERTYPNLWTGFFRGCEGTAVSERYSWPGPQELSEPYSPWSVEEPVVDFWIRNGYEIEPYVAPEEPEE